MSKRLFTVHEANALIPKLEIIMEKLQRHLRVLQDAVEEMARISGEPPEPLSMQQLVEQRPSLRPVSDEVETLLVEIRACGGQFKGLDLGLVDFPAEIDGEPVLLCWQYGEKEIAYYHAASAGFAGRRPLHQGAERSRYLQ